MVRDLYWNQCIRWHTLLLYIQSYVPFSFFYNVLCIYAMELLIIAISILNYRSDRPTVCNNIVLELGIPKHIWFKFIRIYIATKKSKLLILFKTKSMSVECVCFARVKEGWRVGKDGRFGKDGGWGRMDGMEIWRTSTTPSCNKKPPPSYKCFDIMICPRFT